MAGGFRKTRYSKEQDGNSGGNGPSRKRDALSFRGGQARQAHGQSVVRGTNGYTFQATGAFHRANLNEFVDWQRRRARLGTLGAIDTRFRVSADTRGAQP